MHPCILGTLNGPFEGIGTVSGLQDTSACYLISVLGVADMFNPFLLFYISQDH